MIVSFALEFETRAEMEKVVRQLQKRHEVSGELEMLPLGDGRWKLTVFSEKPIRESTLESLPGKRVSVHSTVRRESLQGEE